MSAPFAISFVDEADVRIIDITGELDIKTAPAFSGHFDEAAETGVRNVVVNMCGVSFMDSTGVAALVRGRQQLLKGGARIRLACLVDGGPSKALALAGVDGLFAVYDTPALAVAALQGLPANVSSTGISPAGEVSDLRLEVPALPDHVAGVRRAIVEYAEGLGVSDTWSIALAVSEAVTNAVLHAYADGAPGPVCVLAHARSRRELRVVVEDDGGGLLPRPDSPGIGLGLPLLAQLTRALKIETRREGGTRVSMSFATETLPR